MARLKAPHKILPTGIQKLFALNLKAATRRPV